MIKFGDHRRFTEIAIIPGPKHLSLKIVGKYIRRGNSINLFPEKSYFEWPAYGKINTKFRGLSIPNHSKVSHQTLLKPTGKIEKLNNKPILVIGKRGLSD